MAKLSAHGRKEIFRVSKTVTFEPNSENTCGLRWEKITYALMSDRKILKKVQVQFIGTQGNSDWGHDYGWKVAYTLKASLTPEQALAIFAKDGYMQSR